MLESVDSVETDGAALVDSRLLNLPATICKVVALGVSIEDHFAARLTFILFVRQLLILPDLCQLLFIDLVFNLHIFFVIVISLRLLRQSPNLLIEKLRIGWHQRPIAQVFLHTGQEDPRLLVQQPNSVTRVQSLVILAVAESVADLSSRLLCNSVKVRERIKEEL